MTSCTDGTTIEMAAPREIAATQDQHFADSVLFLDGAPPALKKLARERILMLISQPVIVSDTLLAVLARTGFDLAKKDWEAEKFDLHKIAVSVKKVRLFSRQCL
jgi:hypothetical protein